MMLCKTNKWLKPKHRAVASIGPWLLEKQQKKKKNLSMIIQNKMRLLQEWPNVLAASGGWLF